MPRFRVRVVASYPPDHVLPPYRDTLVYTPDERRVQSAEVKRRLSDWVSARDGRRLTGDHGIDPPRLTLEVTYDDIEAPSEWDARVDAQSMFSEECERDELPEPESVLAHAD
jgi:hypothetical protein